MEFGAIQINPKHHHENLELSWNRGSPKSSISNEGIFHWPPTILGYPHGHGNLHMKKKLTTSHKFFSQLWVVFLFPNCNYPWSPPWAQLKPEELVLVHPPVVLGAASWALNVSGHIVEGICDWKAEKKWRKSEGKTGRFWLFLIPCSY